MNTKNKCSVYSVPDYIKYDVRLKWPLKILASIILGLSKKEGYCYASNAHLAKLMACHKRTIQKYLSTLEKHKVIKIKLMTSKQNNDKRWIFMGAQTATTLEARRWCPSGRTYLIEDSNSNSEPLGSSKASNEKPALTTPHKQYSFRRTY